jgi:beta-1,4-mannosyltransferase
MFNYDKAAKLKCDSGLIAQPRKLKLVITGAGPRKVFFQDLVAKNRSSWRFISIEMIWFKADDYPKILAAADVGVCLHYSSSGLDTPMKIIDMYGCNLPCLAA